MAGEAASEAPPRTVERAALLVVDVQNDFCEGGALAVPGASRVVGTINRYLDEAVRCGMTIYASRDWHPPATRHFKAYGGEWPAHCVQETPGARFHEALRLPATTVVVTKGEQEDRPGYSAFEGRTPEGANLRDDLQRQGVNRLYVAGLATDYCVRASVVDALAAGLQVTVLEDAIAGVNLRPDDSEQALREMRERGAVIARGVSSLTNG